MFTNRAEELELLIKARYPLIYIISWDERRIEDMLRGVAGQRDKRLFAWTATQGIFAIGTGQPAPVDPAATDPMQALNYVAESREAAIFLFKDFHNFLVQDFVGSGRIDAARIVRKLRDLVQMLKRSEKTLVFLSPLLRLPAELEKEVCVLDFQLPSLEELDDTLERVIRSARMRGMLHLNLEGEQRERVLKAAQGLTIGEAENVFSKSVVLKRGFDLDIIIAEKKQQIRKSGILEYTEPHEHMGHVGGLTELKRWLQKRQMAFGERDPAVPTLRRGSAVAILRGGSKNLIFPSL